MNISFVLSILVIIMKSNQNINIKFKNSYHAEHEHISIINIDDINPNLNLDNLYYNINLSFSPSFPGDINTSNINLFFNNQNITNEINNNYSPEQNTISFKANKIKKNNRIIVKDLITPINPIIGLGYNYFIILNIIVLDKTTHAMLDFNSSSFMSDSLTPNKWIDYEVETINNFNIDNHCLKIKWFNRTIDLVNYKFKLKFKKNILSEKLKNNCEFTSFFGKYFCEYKNNIDNDEIIFDFGPKNYLVKNYDIWFEFCNLINLNNNEYIVEFILEDRERNNILYSDNIKALLNKSRSIFGIEFKLSNQKENEISDYIFNIKSRFDMSVEDEIVIKMPDHLYIANSSNTYEYKVQINNVINNTIEKEVNSEIIYFKNFDIKKGDDIVITLKNIKNIKNSEINEMFEVIIKEKNKLALKSYRFNFKYE